MYGISSRAPSSRTPGDHRADLDEVIVEQLGIARHQRAVADDQMRLAVEFERGEQRANLAWPDDVDFAARVAQQHLHRARRAARRSALVGVRMASMRTACPGLITSVETSCTVRPKAFLINTGPHTRTPIAIHPRLPPNSPLTTASRRRPGHGENNPGARATHSLRISTRVVFFFPRRTPSRKKISNSTMPPTAAPVTTAFRLSSTLR